MTQFGLVTFEFSVTYGSVIDCGGVTRSKSWSVEAGHQTQPRKVLQHGEIYA